MEYTIHLTTHNIHIATYYILVTDGKPQMDGFDYAPEAFNFDTAYLLKELLAWLETQAIAPNKAYDVMFLNDGYEFFFKFA